MMYRSSHFGTVTRNTHVELEELVSCCGKGRNENANAVRSNKYGFASTV